MISLDDNFTKKGPLLSDAVGLDWEWISGGGQQETGQGRVDLSLCQDGCVGGRCTGRRGVKGRPGGGRASQGCPRWWCEGGTSPGQGDGMAGAPSPSPSCTWQGLRASQTLVSALSIPWSEADLPPQVSSPPPSNPAAAT